MNSYEIKKALKAYHKEPWIFFAELRMGTGYTPTRMAQLPDGRWHQVPGRNSVQQSIDAWAIHPYPSMGLLRVSYEIKVSRSDFRAELAQPQKRQQALKYSNEFYFVAPKGLLSRDEMPPECGLREIDERGRVLTTLKAPCRRGQLPSWKLIASLARRCAVDEVPIEERVDEEAHD